jgi:hypothetical protein
MPVILIRSISKKHKNGMRFVVKGITKHLLTVQPLSSSAPQGSSNPPQAGSQAQALMVDPDSIVLIPRIPLEAAGVYPFTLRRRQFPVLPAFALTMNKCQGQTLRTVGIYLPTPPFSHGQLYVALSRVTTAGGVEVFIPPGCQIREIYDEEAQSIINVNETFPHHILTENVVYQEVLWVLQ